MFRIFKVSGWLDAKGFEKRIHEIEVTETANTYRANPEVRQATVSIGYTF